VGHNGIIFDLIDLLIPDQEFLDGTSPRIYPGNQSKIKNPQAPAFIRGVNPKSKI